MPSRTSKLKVIRDPVYDYITIDLERDGWVLDLLSTRAVQRLRRIRQLGVSCVTYPGAVHTRLGHSLGVLHLARMACDHLERTHRPRGFDRQRKLLLAAAVLHDVGHGPFSHLLEDEFGGSHENWSARIIHQTDAEDSSYGEVADILRERIDRDAPGEVAAILGVGEKPAQPWVRCLVAGELDLDRLDYLRRDAHFSGAQCGHYDYHRIINSIQLQTLNRQLYPVWPDRCKYAIEEFIFARFYMYRAVYLHPTTRGYERLLKAVVRRAREAVSSSSVTLHGAMQAWLSGSSLSVSEFLSLDDSTLLGGLTEWRSSDDPILADLSGRFLDRRGLKPFEIRPARAELERSGAVEKAKLLLQERGYDPRYYLLEDKGQTRYYRPYRPELAGEEASPMTAIFLHNSAAKPRDRFREISTELNRVRHVAGTTEPYHYMFCPDDMRGQLDATINAT